MDIKAFVKKNQKYITIALICLFFLKTFQSCNRNMTINKLNKELIYTSDSLNKIISTDKSYLIEKINIANDSIKELNYKVKLAESNANNANRRANAVQSTAEKVRKNTTIKIENNTQNRDTANFKNK